MTAQQLFEVLEESDMDAIGDHTIEVKIGEGECRPVTGLAFTHEILDGRIDPKRTLVLKVAAAQRQSGEKKTREEIGAEKTAAENRAPRTKAAGDGPPVATP